MITRAGKDRLGGYRRVAWPGSGELSTAPEGRWAMRFLVVGAGATGGYFGGRLLEAGGEPDFVYRGRLPERVGK